MARELVQLLVRLMADLRLLMEWQGQGQRDLPEKVKVR